MKAILLGVALAFTAASSTSAYAETTIIKKRGHSMHKKVIIKHHGGMGHGGKTVVIKHKMD